MASSHKLIMKSSPLPPTSGFCFLEVTVLILSCFFLIVTIFLDNMVILSFLDFCFRCYF